jgi:hypothetical protein
VRQNREREVTAAAATTAAGRQRAEHAAFVCPMRSECFVFLQNGTDSASTFDSEFLLRSKLLLSGDVMSSSRSSGFAKVACSCVPKRFFSLRFAWLGAYGNSPKAETAAP